MREPSHDLKKAITSLRLGKLLPTLPERLRIARERSMDPEDFLLLLLTEEIQRRDQERHVRRAQEAGLSPSLVFDAWDRSTGVTYDTHLLDELRTLRFLERHHHVLIAGPVGVGKTMVAHALGHLAILRNHTVHYESTDKLLKRLKAYRLDARHEQELKRLREVDLLILDDLALRKMDALETADLYELVSARHQQGSIIVTSNRDPSEWLDVLGDPLQAQALVDRFSNNALDLILEGPSYRRRQKPTPGK